MALAKFLVVGVWPLGLEGLWLRYATLQNLIPSFPWIAPTRPPPWRNPRKGRDQILPSGNLVQGLPRRRQRGASNQDGAPLCRSGLPGTLHGVFQLRIGLGAWGSS